MIIRLYLLFLAFAFFGAGAIASPVTITDPSGTVVVLGVDPPRYVYHWVDYETLAKIAKDKKFSDPWDRFADLHRSSFYQFWSRLNSQRTEGLFAWTHPVLGMKGGRSENYGEALVRLELDVEKIKAMQVKTADKPYDFSSPLDVSDVDLVMHDKNGLFKEWVILNPEVIKNFTADVDVLMPILKKELKRLKDPSQRYSPDEVHFSDFKAKGFEDHRSYAIHILTNLIESNRDAIPSYFRRDTNGNPIFAKFLSGRKALRTTILAEALRRYKKNHPHQHHSAESIRSALSKIQPGVVASGADFESELNFRIQLHVLEHPADSALKEIADLLPLLNFHYHKFVSEVNQRTSDRLRQAPFDPFRSILDMLFLSDGPFRNAESLADRKLEFILETLANSSLAESFRRSYEKDFLGNAIDFKSRKGQRLSAAISKAGVRSCKWLLAN